MSDSTSNPGTWAAAVGGAGLGGAAGYGAVTLHQARRGVKVAFADKVHGFLDMVSSPDRMKSTASAYEKALNHLGGIERIVDFAVKNLPDGFLEKVVRTESRNEEEEIEITLKEELLSLQKTVKGKSTKDIPQKFWEDVHQGISKIKPAMEAVGIKKSFVASVPGGIHTLTSASALVGAAASYMMVAGIQKSHADAIEQAAKTSAAHEGRS